MSNVKIELPKIERGRIEMILVGDSPLICHAWSDAAKKAMLDKQMKKAKASKAAKSPEDDVKASLYQHPDGGYGFPAIAFKRAAVAACRFAETKMTEARGAFHIVGEYVKIEGDMEPREDMVRVGMGTADIRYRGSFPKWRARLVVDHNVNAMSAEQVVNLFNLAGFGVGVGDWRPERNGIFGRFHVATEEESRG